MPRRLRLDFGNEDQGQESARPLDRPEILCISDQESAQDMIEDMKSGLCPLCKRQTHNRSHFTRGAGVATIDRVVCLECDKVVYGITRRLMQSAVRVNVVVRSLCPNCHGAPEKCSVCFNTGWV